MDTIIVAIALICGPDVCENKAHGPRFETIKACNEFLADDRIRQSANGNLVVLDDCIITTEERLKAFR